MVRRFNLSLMVVALVVAVLPAAAGAASPSATVFVAADASWVASGVVVEAGDELSIRAHGHAITGPLSEFPGAHSGPAGQAFLCPDAGGPAVGCNLDGVPYGALVAKIGATVFLVGGSYAGIAPDSGEIMLAVNDNLGFHFDNKAGFPVQIRSN